jgi:hypothetical protein
MTDPKSLGIPNINFSIYTDNDKREERFLKQRLERGFDESETWSLYSTISSFILPRLKEFKEVNICYPPELTPDEWNIILDKMIRAFEIAKNSDFMKEEESEEFREGFNLFSEYFFALWW